MKICLCTTPIRPKPTTYPPFGSLAVIQALRKVGENTKFYHIDYHRYNDAQNNKYFLDNQFDIVAISAVVSTAYAYTKYLVNLVKNVSPKTKIIVGGGLAASSEILHRKAKVDYCVIGDGEIIIQNLVQSIRENKTSDSDLSKIKGITYIDNKDVFRFTGYEHALPSGLIERPDWTILEQDKSIDHYIREETVSYWQDDTEDWEEGKKITTIEVAKGCVARCTFCHRFEKGYRVSPQDSIIQHMKMLKEKYNVKYFTFGDENFGSYKKETLELIEKMSAEGFIWRAGGVRAHTVDLETLKTWKRNGCFNVTYGIESGSPTMLKVMEKKITVEQNIKALKWTYEAGLSTILQLVIGMPGETDKTIDETIDFMMKTMPYYSDVFRKQLSLVFSVNYAQALPGTPLYEWAREHKYVGKDIDSEEAYLIKISDTDAYDNDHFLNYTQQPLLKVLGWRTKIYWKAFRWHATNNLNIKLTKIQILKGLISVIINKIFKTKINSSLKKTLDSCYTGIHKDQYYNNSDYSYLQYGLKLLLPWNKWTYPFISILVAYKEAKNAKWFFKLIFDHIIWSFNVFKKFDLPKDTLRKIVQIRDTDQSLEIRKGR